MTHLSTTPDAIIFDLGGVILDIDYQRTVNAFQLLGHPNFEQEYSQAKQSGLFDLLEMGKISAEEFRNQLRKHLPNRSDEDINSAWNAIILNFPPGRIEFIRTIGSRLKTFLLSNTNAIHADFFNTILADHHGVSGGIKSIFHQGFLSHEIGYRKPMREAFELILDSHQLNAERTLFIDDSEQHISAASSLGIQTLHLTSIHDLEERLRPILAELDQDSV